MGAGEWRGEGTTCGGKKKVKREGKKKLKGKRICKKWHNP